MTLKNYRTILERRKGERQGILRDIKETKKKISVMQSERKNLEDAQVIIQTVAQATQKELEYHVSELVSLALEAVFPDPYQLHLDFELRRKRSEADLTFSKRDGEKIHPIDASGGGAVDVASCALRFSLWGLKPERTRPTIVLDEPFKFVNDPTRKLHKKVATMLKMISEKLGVQIIIVTLSPEFIETADKVFETTIKNGVSKVKELQ